MIATTKTTNIWIVDDHEVFAKQINRLIAAEPDMECTQHFSSAGDLFEKLQFTRDFPDLLLLDLGLPRRSGLDILPDIRKIMPNSKILVLTASDDREKVYRAICNGASGYLLKTADPDDIIEGTLEGLDECRRLPEESLPRPVHIGRDIEKPTPEKPLPRQIKHGRARSLIRLRGGDGVTQPDRQQHQKPTAGSGPSH
jgi:DNA-binding NarL/FixJ family response regulator